MDLQKSDLPSPALNDLTEFIQHNDPNFSVTTETSHRFPDAALAMTLASIAMPEFVTNTGCRPSRVGGRRRSLQQRAGRVKACSPSGRCSFTALV